MKHCSICNTEKQLEQFPSVIKKRNNGTVYTYYKTVCKSCDEKARYLRRKTNPAAYERMKARSRNRVKRKYDENPQPSLVRSKQWVKKQIDTNIFKRTWLKNKYGITLDDYNQLRINQDYKCAICNTSEEYLGYLLHVDHCHEKGHVRGLLCVNCNTAIGKFNHNITILNCAIKYLQS